jgi:alkylhydroperoxidase family enzyme
MAATALENVAWVACLFEPHQDSALESYARRKWGIPSPATRYFAPVPWLARALVDLHAELGLLMHLEQNVADLVTLVVSQENSCRFCYAAVRALLWAGGMSTARVQRVEEDLRRMDLPSQTIAALAFGRGQSRTGPQAAGAAREALLAAGLGADELREIAYVVASTDFSNRAHTIAAIPSRPLERLPDQVHMRLIRPLLNRVLKSHCSRGQATPLNHTPSGPYARLVKAYEGSPIAPALGRTLEEMWASPHLTRRCKLLMLAVVARGLACEVCAPVLVEALEREGLAHSAVVQALVHLDAPELDPIERLLVPFARETIWYEPARVQRRARGLRDRLTDSQLLEAIGVAALANGLCRMGAMVLEHP